MTADKSTSMFSQKNKFHIFVFTPPTHVFDFLHSYCIKQATKWFFVVCTKDVVLHTLIGLQAQ